MRKIFLIILSLITSLFFLSSCDENSNQKEKKIEMSESFEEEHNAENSLDIPGLYVGEFPCQDCPGIIVEVTLENDYTYSINTLYKGNETTDYLELGNWSIDKNILTLQEEKGGSTKYFVGENFIHQMDAEGNKMYGEKEGEYILKKKLEVNQAI